MKSSWIKSIPVNDPNFYQFTLFCLPYAGGGASIFHNWQEQLKTYGIKVCSIALPGREGRLTDASIDNALELTRKIYNGIKTELRERPFMTLTNRKRKDSNIIGDFTENIPLDVHFRKNSNIFEVARDTQERLRDYRKFNTIGGVNII